MKKEYSTVLNVIEEMMTYFSKLNNEHETKLQEYKAKLFETNIKLDELVKTQNVYSLNVDYRKNVFSPIVFEPEETEKEAEIRNEINSLQALQNKYEYGISEESIYIKSIVKRLKNLNEAKNSLSSIMRELDNQKETNRKKDLIIEADKAREQKRLNDEKTNELKDEIKVRSHLENILMLSTYDDTLLSTLLDKKVKTVIEENNKKIENAKGYIYGTPGRSKVLLDEVTNSQKSLIQSINSQLNKMNYEFDDEMPIEKMLKEYIEKEMGKHTNIKYTYSIDGVETTPDYIRYVVLNSLLNIFFENIYKHSKASMISFKADEEDDILYFEIRDNGIGIPDNYLEKTEWYSGIKRAKELLFMISGKLDIKNDNGTIVRFSFNHE